MSFVIEHDIEQYLVDRVEKLGGKSLKFISAYQTGMPDRIIILPGGIVAFVELKRPKGGRISEIQKYQIGKLKKLGAKVYVIQTKEEADKMLGELTHG